MKDEKTIMLVIGIIIAVAIFHQYSINFTIISAGGELPEQIRNIQWNGINAKFTSPYFGTITSGSSVASNDFANTGITNPNTKYSICGYNDPGKVTISNNYDNGEKLTFSSSTGGSGSCGGNFIRSEMTLPVGIYNSSCTLNVNNAPGWVDGLSSCTIIREGEQIYSKTLSADSGQSLSQKDSIIITLEDPSQITFYLTQTDSNEAGSASTSASLEIIEDINTGGENNNSNQNQTSQNQTQNTTVIYQDCDLLGCPSNYTCLSGVCIRDNVTIIEKDCSTLGCPSNYECVNDLCVEKDEEPGFFQKYGLAGFITTILGSVIGWLILKRK